MAEPTGLFVYGTLKSGERNAAFVEPVSRRLVVLNRGCLYHLPPPAGYPALYLDGRGPVGGELLRFTDIDAVLAELDRLEGRPRLFIRSIVQVGGDGSPQTAWTYHFPSDRPVPPGAVEIVNGVWRSRDFT